MLGWGDFVILYICGYSLNISWIWCELNRPIIMILFQTVAHLFDVVVFGHRIPQIHTVVDGVCIIIYSPHYRSLIWSRSLRVFQIVNCDYFIIIHMFIHLIIIMMGDGRRNLKLVWWHSRNMFEWRDDACVRSFRCGARMGVNFFPSPSSFFRILW